MPTLVIIDGFDHQGLTTNGAGLWNTLSNAAGNITFDTTNKRTGLASLKIVQNNTNAISAQKNTTASTQVGSFYVRVTSAPSTEGSIHVGETSSSTHRMKINITTGGAVAMQIGTGTQQTGPNVADGNWHLIDYRYNGGANPVTCDWAVDEVAQTQAVATGGPGTMVAIYFGSNAAGGTVTSWRDDFVLSTTSGDYPIGPHEVQVKVPDGDGTHNGGTNTIENNSGTDIVPGYTNADDLINEWPAEVTDYIRCSADAPDGTQYAEMTLEDTAAATVWDVHGYLAYTSAATQANNGTTRIVLSDGTTVDNIHAGDMSDGSTANLFYKSKLLTRPSGGWTPTNFNGAKCRVGFTTDGNPDPYWIAVLLNVAVPVSVGEPDSADLTILRRSGLSRWGAN